MTTSRTRTKPATLVDVSFNAYGGSAPENYERYFVPAIGAPLAADLIEVANVRPGERVVDVACGTGIVARLAAQRVGATGTVTGVDLNPAMLAVARSHTSSAIAIDWHHAPAESTALSPAAYDAVLCQMGLQFFGDKPASLIEMRRLLAPEGRLALNVPGPSPAIFTILEEALLEHAGVDAGKFVRAVFSIHDSDSIRDLIAAAGFGQIRVQRSTKRLPLPAPADFLWQYVWSTPLAGVIAQMDRHRRTKLQHRVMMQWEPFTEDGRLVLQLDVTTALAHARA